MQRQFKLSANSIFYKSCRQMPSDRALANNVLNENCGAKTCEDESVLIKRAKILSW